MEKSSVQNSLMTSMTKLLINQNKIINSPEFQSFKKILQRHKKGYSQIFLSVSAKPGEETENIMQVLQSLRNSPEDELFRLFDFMKRKEIHSIDELIEGYMMTQGFRMGKVHEINMLPVSSLPHIQPMSSLNSINNTPPLSGFSAEPASEQTTASPLNVAGSASLKKDEEKNKESVSSETGLHLKPENKLSEELNLSVEDQENNSEEESNAPLSTLNSLNSETESEKSADNDVSDKENKNIKESEQIPADVTMEDSTLSADKIESLHLSPQPQLSRPEISSKEEPEFPINIASYEEELRQKHKDKEERVVSENNDSEKKEDETGKLTRRNRMEEFLKKQHHNEDHTEDKSDPEMDSEDELKKSLEELENIDDDPALAESEEQEVSAKAINKLPNNRFAKLQERKDSLNTSDNADPVSVENESNIEEEPLYTDKEQESRGNEKEEELIQDSYFADVSWKFLSFSEKLGKLLGKYYVIRFSDDLYDKVENDNIETVRMLILKSKQKGLWGISKKRRRQLDAEL